MVIVHRHRASHRIDGARLPLHGGGPVGAGGLQHQITWPGDQNRGDGVAHGDRERARRPVGIAVLRVIIHRGGPDRIGFRRIPTMVIVHRHRASHRVDGARLPLHGGGPVEAGSLQHQIPRPGDQHGRCGVLHGDVERRERLIARGVGGPEVNDHGAKGKGAAGGRHRQHGHGAVLVIHGGRGEGHDRTGRAGGLGGDVAGTADHRRDGVGRRRRQIFARVVFLEGLDRLEPELTAGRAAAIPDDEAEFMWTRAAELNRIPAGAVVLPVLVLEPDEFAVDIDPRGVVGQKLQDEIAFAGDRRAILGPALPGGSLGGGVRPGVDPVGSKIHGGDELPRVRTHWEDRRGMRVDPVGVVTDRRHGLAFRLPG